MGPMDSNQLVEHGSIICDSYAKFLEYYRSEMPHVKFRVAQKRAGALWKLVKEKKEARLEKYSDALRPITHELYEYVEPAYVKEDRPRPRPKPYLSIFDYLPCRRKKYVPLIMIV